VSCAKNCEREVPAVSTRPIGLDCGLPWLLLSAFQDPKNVQPSQVETNFWMGGLLTILQGSVLAHYMPIILHDLGIDTTIAMAEPALDPSFMAHAAATVILLALPGLLALFAEEISYPLENALLSLRNSLGTSTIEEEKANRRIIIDAYETMLQSDGPFQETLAEFDPDGDGRISCWEFERVLVEELQLPVDQREILVNLIRQRLGNKGRKEPVPTEAFLTTLRSGYRIYSLHTP